MISQEYIGAIIIALITGISASFHLALDPEMVKNVVIGLIAIWVAVRRHSKGDITLAGVKRA